MRDRYVSGRRADGSDWSFRLLPAPATGAMPGPVTAVCALINIGGRLLAVRGPRGLDVPGGHLEPGEGPLEALRREVEEEAGACVSQARAVALLESDCDPDHPSYLVVYRAVAELGPFPARHETTERVLIEVNDFVASYTGGNPELMARLIALAWPGRGSQP